MLLLLFLPCNSYSILHGVLLLQIVVCSETARSSSLLHYTEEIGGKYQCLSLSRTWHLQILLCFLYTCLVSRHEKFCNKMMPIPVPFSWCSLVKECTLWCKAAAFSCKLLEACLCMRACDIHTGFFFLVGKLVCEWEGVEGSVDFCCGRCVV